MMSLSRDTRLEEETEDLDWFCIDAIGEIGHFTTGGRGFLPRSAKASKDNLQFLLSFFRDILAENGRAIESPQLSVRVRFQSEEQKRTYLGDYVKMAAKGLYSFDCILDRTRPTGYFLTGQPSCPLKTEQLPNDVKQILLRTRFLGTLCNAETVEDRQFT